MKTISSWAMRYAADALAHEEIVFIGKDSAERQD